MSERFSPMLAERQSAHEFFNELVFPLYASPKLDGIRVLIRDGQAVTRKLLPVANDHIRNTLVTVAPDGFDGEVISGDPTAEDCYNRTQRAMLGNKVVEPEFKFHVFDDFTAPTLPYQERMERIAEFMRRHVIADHVVFHIPTLIPNLAELETYEAHALALGYEGVILRSTFGTYKHGRSTRKQQGMLKLKRFIDGEATIVDFEELMRNENENVGDALGHAKRSSAQAGLVAGGTLGAFVVTDNATGVQFNVGMFKGLTAEQKQTIWNDRDAYHGKVIKYSHFAVGAVDKPRHAKFIGWRNADDV